MIISVLSGSSISSFTDIATKTTLAVENGYHLEIIFSYIFNTFSFRLQLWSLQTEGNPASLSNAYFQGVSITVKTKLKFRD